VSAADEYELIVTPPAARAIAEQLPEPVAVAVIEFLTGTLIERRAASVNRCAASWLESGPPAEAPTAFCTEFSIDHAR